MRITREARPFIREALIKHPDYEATRNRMFPGVSHARLVKAQLLALCAALGIDAAAICRAVHAGQAHTLPHQPSVSSIVTASADADDDDADDDASGFTVSPRAAAATLPDADADADETPAARAERAIADALAPLVPFVADRLLDTVRTALQPMADAFVAPRTATLAPAGNASGTVERSTLGKAFGVKTGIAGNACTIWNAATNVPPRDAFYSFDAERLALVNAAAERGDFVWLTGPSATGKSSFALQYAAHTARPAYRFAFDRAIDVFEFIGSRDVKANANGGTDGVWRDGLFTAAIQQPGALIILEEPTLADPGILGALYTALDERFITLREDGGRIVRFAPGVMIVAADNTDGSGDATGVYAGTRPMSAALMDRFAVILPCDYLPADAESKVLASKAGIPLEAAALIVSFAGHVRNGNRLGVLSHTMTLRRMLAFAGMVRDGAEIATALACTITRHFPATDRETLAQLATAHLDATGLAHAMKGKPLAPAIGSATPGNTVTATGAAAASAFSRAPAARV